jgi:signal transduction histidine kinase
VAQDRLRWYAAGGAVLAAGAAVEVASDQSLATALADWAVGAAFVLAALPRRLGPADPVALLAAVLWFLATLALTPDGWWHGLDGPLALAYRGPVLHLLGRPAATGRLRWPVLLAAYGVPLVVATATGLLTALVAAALAVAVLVGGRDRLAAAALALLAAVWAGTSLGLLHAAVGDAALIVAASVVALRHRSGGAGRAVVGMVVELGQDDRPATPLSASLAEALADPDLRIAIFQPGEGWRDEAGHPVGPPDLGQQAGRVTVVPVPGGGSLALLHGPRGVADPELSAAAARAAVLVLERVRITRQMRLTADEVRRSAARLLAVDEQERQALADRLASGPRRRLARVRRLLHRDEADPAAMGIGERLDEVDAGLDRLARGMLPQAVLGGDLAAALRSLAGPAGPVVELSISGPVDDLPDASRALVFFVTAECLANATRHADAALVAVAVVLDDRLRVEIRDDGVGGAFPLAGHGLQGLADRVTLAGGSFTVDSPAGGPTTIVALLAPPDRSRPA